MEAENRDFKGVWIPRIVWLDKRLNALDKVILTEIDSLDQGEKGCYASNQHLAEFCQCSERKVSAAISKLIELGYVYVESFDGRRRTLRSSLATIAKQPSKICEAESQNLRESNTENNTVNNTKKKKERKTATGYDEIISNFTDDDSLRSALYEFIKMRKLIKKPMTDRALSMLVSKLEKLTSDTASQIAILEQSIMHNWQDVYPLKDTQPSQQTKQVELSSQEQERQRAMMEYFALAD